MTLAHVDRMQRHNLPAGLQYRARYLAFLAAGAAPKQLHAVTLLRLAGVDRHAGPDRLAHPRLVVQPPLGFDGRGDARLENLGEVRGHFISATGFDPDFTHFAVLGVCEECGSQGLKDGSKP